MGKQSNNMIRRGLAQAGPVWTEIFVNFRF